MSLLLRNPHSVLAALRTRPGDVQELVLSGKGAGDAWDRVAALAKSQGIRVTSATKATQDRSSRGAAHDARGTQAEARVRERDGISAEELFEGASTRAGGKGLWLALDSLQDPHNVGAIFRTAAFFGVQGILLTEERSAPLTGTVYDVAAGGVEHVPFVLQTNLQRGFEVAKEAGLWILGTSEHATDSLFKVERDRPWLLVLGNEEKGLRRLTEESCDLLCAIPCKGEVTSLNVSVAAGIAIGHLGR